MPENETTIDRPSLAWFLLLDGGLVLLAALALLPGVADRVRAHLPVPSTKVLRTILLLAIVVHLGEGVTAWVLASKRGLDARRWATQTAIVGFPSLRLLASHQAA